MPKRRRCGERDAGGSTAAEPRQPRRRLYLVCDDWDSGYSIRKLSLPADSGDDGGAAGGEPGLPKLFWRVAGQRQFPHHFTSAFGPKILGGQIIDVRARCVLSARLEKNYPVHPIYFPVRDDRLFAMDSSSFELCRFPPEQSDSESDSDSNGDWSWHQLRPYPPFFRVHVTSYAMLPHGDGHTVLVSTNSAKHEYEDEDEDEEDDKEEEEDEEKVTATFSFGTGASVWKNLGEWTLPFTGRGHYELRALVGLSKSKDPKAFGYLYACDVPSTGNTHCPAPAWKRSKEKVFSKNPADRHVSASLVYLGHQRKFCLVECVLVEEDNNACDEVKVKEDKAGDQVLLEKPKGAGVPQRGRYMYRLMTFSLKYDKMGDLRVRHRRVRYYKVPSKASTECIRRDPVVFWL